MSLPHSALDGSLIVAFPKTHYNFWTKLTVSPILWGWIQDSLMGSSYLQRCGGGGGGRGFDLLILPDFLLIFPDL